MQNCLLQTLLKYLLFIYYKRDIQGIFSDRLKWFWKYKGLDKKVVRQIEKIYNTTKLLQLIIMFVMVFCVYLYLLKPLFNKDMTFLFDSKVFINSIGLEILVLAFHYYLLLIIMPIVFGYDIIYLSLCIDLLVQVKLLKYKLKSMLSKPVGQADITETISCIHYHLLLLS